MLFALKGYAVDNRLIQQSCRRLYANDIDVNAEMIKQRLAWVYFKYLKEHSLFELQKNAIINIGLWEIPETERQSLWEWRKQYFPVDK